MLCKCIFIFAHQHVVPPTSDIARNPRKCGESCAKASRKLRHLNQALLSQTATLGSGRWIKSHVFNVRPLMKGCDSFIVKWQGPPRKLAKEVFEKFILAKEKMRSRKSGERFWRKTMWLEQNHTRFSTQLTWKMIPMWPFCCFQDQDDDDPPGSGTDSEVLGISKGKSRGVMGCILGGFYHGFTKHVFMIYMPYAGVSSSFYLEDQSVY